MKEKVKQIMLKRLNEMSEESFRDEACYNGCCSVMNEIAQTLLQCGEKEDAKEEKSLKDYSTLELFKELANRKGIYVTENKEIRTDQYIDKYPITNCELTLKCKYNGLTGEVVE